MPKYTQCTSLGKLVRKKHLIEIDAISKLAKAKTRRQEEIDYLEAEKQVAANMEARKMVPKKQESQRQRQDSLQSNLFRKFIGLRGENSKKELDDSRNDGSIRLRKLSDLVKEQTKNLPDEAILRRRSERRRARSVSDGVAAMRLFSSTSALAQEALTTSALVEKDDPEVKSMKGELDSLPIPTRPKGRRRKMVSTGVFLMQSEQPSLLSENEDGGASSEWSSTLSAQPVTKLQNGSEPDHILLGQRDSLLDRVTPDNFKVVQRARSSNNTQANLMLSTVQEMHKENSPTKLEVLDDDLSIESEGHLDDDLSLESGESIEKRENFQLTEEVEDKVELSEQLEKMFLNKKYGVYSALFGTMPIFFFLSYRIETLLLDTCVMKDNENTWNFLPTRGTTFWFTVSWFFVLLIESSTMCLLSCRKNSKIKVEMVAPALFDIMLTALCLGLFLWAEVRRCCKCENSSVMYKAAAPTEKGGCVYDEYSKCCPSFGTRLCGGLGSVEPFASLIALRLFRVYTSRLCLSFIKRIHELISKDNSQNQGATITNIEDDDDNDGIPEHFDSHGKMEHKTGTIAELWIHALAEYPDIVKEHGLFSGLLLEAMLGIDALPKDERNKEEESDKVAEGEKIPIPKLQFLDDQRKMPSLRRGISTMSLHSASGNSMSDLNMYDNNFVRPGAPLIRSMRRCQCKWEWMKSAAPMQWDIVDVVVTESEIVWFNGLVDLSYWDDQERKRVQNIKEAIIAKRGGKGLRLSDVAAGREVLGRMALTDIDNIKIQRHVPFTPSVKSNEVNVIGLDLEESRKTVFKEFWIENNKLNLPLDKQWEKFTEDRLRLHSKQGTLTLRFFVDLYEAVDPSSAKDDIERKKGALLWCQSISHLCGKNQLKQKLPHFGEDRDHELQDFIDITSRFRDEDDNKHFSWLPRQKSEARLAQTFFQD